MRQFPWVLAGWISLAVGPALAQKDKTPAITWEKTVIENVFRSEGVAVADFNKDGKLDVFVGEAWYEAPSWKMHVVRRDKPFDPHGYSESFACFADDFSGDGYPDVVVIPFPGKACFWYENPGKAGGKWKEHPVTTSACNETPIFVDLFKTGKKVVVMGWQPPGKEDMGEMCWFSPGTDPTVPWIKHPISVPSEKGKEVPGTRRFSHGLGHGDVNGDGRFDVIVTEGWWEQPEKVSDSPWKFHPAKLGAACADMYAKDLNGDKLADVISTSAHGFGLWLHKQVPGKDGSAFVQEPLATGEALVKNPKNHRLNPEEKGLLDAINKFRATQKVSLPAFKPSAELCRASRKTALKTFNTVETKGNWEPQIAIADGAKNENNYFGVKLTISGNPAVPEIMKTLEKEVLLDLRGSFSDIGLAVVQGEKGCIVEIGVYKNSTPFRGDIVVWDEMAKIPVSQTHALVEADINGDGLPDLVTGRRWWAHGAAGDPASAEPAFVFWFRAAKDETGKITFTPEVIDDDSGIGTQFVVIDIDGDGLLDIVVANKRGIFINRQVRSAAAIPVPGGRKD